eukprot:105860-Amphidinium_carterae.1
MCETFVRSQDARRLARSTSAHGGPEERHRPRAKRASHSNLATDIFAAGGSDNEAADEDKEDEHGEHRQSLKASYIAKVLSPLIGYGADHELT